MNMPKRRKTPYKRLFDTLRFKKEIQGSHLLVEGGVQELFGDLVADHGADR